MDKEETGYSVQTAGLNELFNELSDGKAETDEKIYLPDGYDENSQVHFSDMIRDMEEVFEDIREKGEIPELAQLTPANINSFSTLIPPDISERINLPYIYGIGILALGTKKYAPAGVLLYRLHKSSDGNRIEIEWINVSSKKRRLGYAKALLNELATEAVSLNADSLILDLPASDASEEMTAFLGHFGFSFSLQISPITSLPYSEVMKLLVLNDDVKDPRIRFVKDISASTFKRSLQQILGNTSDDTLDILNTDISWYDTEISSVLMSGATPIAMLLFHRCPTGKLQIVFMGGAQSVSSKDYMILMQAAAKEEKTTTLNDNYDIEILLRSESGMTVVDNLYPNHPARLVIRAGIAV